MKREIVYITGIILLIWVGGNTKLPACIQINETNSMHKIYEKNPADSIIIAKKLYDTFKKEEAVATEKYVKQTITIKGLAVYVGADVYALPSVELSENKGGKSRILCVLPFSDYLKLRKVSKGDEVVITGEVRGFYEKGDQVLLKRCEIKEVIKNSENKKL